MEEKKELRVDKSTSKKVGIWQGCFAMLGWLSLIAGIFTTIAGIDKANQLLYSETRTLFIGISLLVLAIVFLFNSALLKGVITIVQSSEYKKALVEDKFLVVENERTIEEMVESQK